LNSTFTGTLWAAATPRAYSIAWLSSARWSRLIHSTTQAPPAAGNDWVRDVSTRARVGSKSGGTNGNAGAATALAELLDDDLLDAFFLAGAASSPPLPPLRFALIFLNNKKRRTQNGSTCNKRSSSTVAATSNARSR
jgi:hypothetical protein